MLFLIFFLGLVIGSFLNVCICRIPQKKSIIFPGSHCTHCKEHIRPFDLIPVISYLLLRGKCRSCGERISPRYPFIELMTAVLFTILAVKTGLDASAFLLMIMTSILIVIAAVDLDYQIIPDGLIYALGAAGALYVLTVLLPRDGVYGLLSSAIGFALGGGLLLIAAIVSKGGVGGGDIKLTAVLGLWFGWKNLLLLLMLSFISGSVVSICLLLINIKSRKDGIPFAPFIAFSAYITSLFGNEIINWYLMIYNR